MNPLRDLPAKYDVKGGSPRSPSQGIPVAEYQQYVENGNGVWRAISTGLGGLVVGLLLAWFQAFQKAGVTHQELVEYEDKYSPYMQQKDVLAQNNRIQDQEIGAVQAVQQRNVERLNVYDSKFHDDERDIVELQGKVKTFADFIEELRKAKK